MNTEPEQPRTLREIEMEVSLTPSWVWAANFCSVEQTIESARLNCRRVTKLDHACAVRCRGSDGLPVGCGHVGTRLHLV